MLLVPIVWTRQRQSSLFRGPALPAWPGHDWPWSSAAVAPLQLEKRVALMQEINGRKVVGLHNVDKMVGINHLVQRHKNIF